MRNSDKEKGLSLLEVLMAVAVFFVAVTSVFQLYIGSYRSTVYGLEKSEATFLAREGVEAVRSIFNGDNEYFQAVASDFEGGVEIVFNRWAFKLEPEVIDDKYIRTVRVAEVIEGEKWLIESVVKWDLSGTESSMEVSFQEQITNWQEPYPVEYELTVLAGEGGEVLLPEEAVTLREYEEIVIISAEAQEGYVFVEWSGDVDTVDDTTAITTTITIEDEYIIIAEFAVVED